MPLSAPHRSCHPILNPDLMLNCLPTLPQLIICVVIRFLCSSCDFAHAAQKSPVISLKTPNQLLSSIY